MAGPTKEAVQYRVSSGKTKVIVPVVTTWEESGQKTDKDRRLHNP